MDHEFRRPFLHKHGVDHSTDGLIVCLLELYRAS
jgi:hypothetical protein